MEILLEPIQESLMTVPVLFLACLLVEYISNRDVVNKVMEFGKVGPFIGAILGSNPSVWFFSYCGPIIFDALLDNGNFIINLYCHK